MLRMFFDFGHRIGWEACAAVGMTLALMLITGFAVELIIQARKQT